MRAEKVSSAGIPPAKNSGIKEVPKPLQREREILITWNTNEGIFRGLGAGKLKLYCDF